MVIAVALMSYDAGRKSAAIKAGEAIAKNWKARGKIDDETARMDGYKLCISLGGVLGECEQLRRLD